MLQDTAKTYNCKHIVRGPVEAITKRSQPLQIFVTCYSVLGRVSDSYTLLPTCWIFRKTGFHAGLWSFFKTSVLQIGEVIPLSKYLDIVKNGSCKKHHNMFSYSTQHVHNGKIYNIYQRKKFLTFLAKRSLYSKSKHLSTNSVEILELTHSSAHIVSWPNFPGWLGLVESSIRLRSIVNDLFDLVIIYRKEVRILLVKRQTFNSL